MVVAVKLPIVAPVSVAVLVLALPTAVQDPIEKLPDGELWLPAK